MIMTAYFFGWLVQTGFQGEKNEIKKYYIYLTNWCFLA